MQHAIQSGGSTHRGPRGNSTQKRHCSESIRFYPILLMTRILVQKDYVRRAYETMIRHRERSALGRPGGGCLAMTLFPSGSKDMEYTTPLDLKQHEPGM